MQRSSKEILDSKKEIEKLRGRSSTDRENLGSRKSYTADPGNMFSFGNAGKIE